MPFTECNQYEVPRRLYYREIAADPESDRTAVEEARVKWKAWERELGSQADSILAILDYLERPAESAPAAAQVPRLPIATALARPAAERKRRAYAG